jgi:hypothetical protein
LIHALRGYSTPSGHHRFLLHPRLVAVAGFEFAYFEPAVRQLTWVNSPATPTVWIASVKLRGCPSAAGGIGP